MNNDIPQPHNAFNGDNQPGQPAPRFGEERRSPQPVDSFSRPQNPNSPQRPPQPVGAPRPRQDITYMSRSSYGSPPQPAPARPVSDSNFAPPSQPRPATNYPQQPMPAPQQMPPRQASDPRFAPQQAQQSVAPQSNSTYPTPGGGAPQTAQTTPHQASNIGAKAGVKNGTIATLVMVFGGFMVLMSALSLVTWLSVGLKDTDTVVGFLLSLAELGLGVGILMKRELARFIYVIVACVSLVFSIYGTFNYISQQSKDNSSNSSQMIGLRQAIQKYQNDTSISDAQRAKYIDVLQKSETVVQQQQTSIDNIGKVVVPFRNILIGYVIAILPIVFLTRPGVKKVFS